MVGDFSRRTLLVAATLVVGMAMAACGDDSGSGDGDNGNSDGETGDYVVTFEVSGEETYRVLLTDEGTIERARQWLNGEAGPFIPNGEVVRGETGVNEGWSWHIDPGSLEFAEMTMEVCDGLPSDVEDGTITSDRFCPWTAEIVALEEA